MEPKSHQSRLKSVKRKVWKPTPKNKQKKCRKGSPRTLQSRAFVQEGSHKSLNPVVPKKHRKRLQNSTQNGAKSHQKDVLEPPRERHKNRRGKASLTDTKRPPKGTPKWSQIHPKSDSAPKKAPKRGGFLSRVAPGAQKSPKSSKKYVKNHKISQKNHAEK